MFSMAMQAGAGQITKRFDLYMERQINLRAKPTFFDGLNAEPTDVAPVTDARILALLGDSITTDHISPAGSIKADSPAGKYLSSNKVKPLDFNPTDLAAAITKL